MKIDIRVVLLDGQSVTRHLRTPKGRRLTGAGMDMLWKQEADHLEKHFPDREFRLAPLHGGSFNFIEIPKEVDADGAGEMQAANVG